MHRHTRWLPRLIGPGILVYFLCTTNVDPIVRQLRSAHALPLLVSLALYPVFVGLKAWRWSLLLRKLGMPAPPLRLSMQLYMIGLFAGGATPGQAGDFIKAWYLRERGHSLASALFSILLDRLFDLLVMAMLSLAGLAALLHLFPVQFRAPIALATAGCAAVLTLAIPLLIGRRTREWLMLRLPRQTPGGRTAIGRWRDQLAQLELRPQLIAGLVLLTLCSASLAIGRVWLLFRALEIDVPVAAVVSSTALVSLLQSLPISFSGVGVRDAVLVIVLGAYGYPSAAALALSTLVLLLNLQNVAVGFLVSLQVPRNSALENLVPVHEPSLPRAADTAHHRTASGGSGERPQ